MTLAPPDTTPPSEPTGLTVDSVGATTVDLSWIASTDDVAVDHYNVYPNHHQNSNQQRK